MGRQGVGDGVHGGAQGPLAVAGGHLPGQGAAVLLADPFGHALGRHRPEQLERLLQQEDQQIVAAGQQVEGGVVADGPESLRRASGAVAGDPFHGHFDVAAARQTLEVVAGHVGMQRETGGHLGGGRAGVGADEEVDLPPGRVAEGRRDRGHRGGELVVRLAGVRVPFSSAPGPRAHRCPGASPSKSVCTSPSLPVKAKFPEEMLDVHRRVPGDRAAVAAVDRSRAPASVGGAGHGRSGPGQAEAGDPGRRPARSPTIPRWTSWSVG